MQRKFMTLFRLFLAIFCFSAFNATAQNIGDPNKFSTTPGNSSCQFFDGYSDNGNGTVTDPRDGLIWKRCAEGFNWDGSSCQGRVKNMNWFDAMKAAKDSRFLGKNNWRLPTYTELLKVVGTWSQCQRNDISRGQYAASLIIAHPLNSSGDPGFFWSSTGSEKDSGQAKFVTFKVGYTDLTDAGKLRDYSDMEVRFVREESLSNSKSSTEFDREIDKTKKYRESASKSRKTMEDELKSVRENTTSLESGRKLCTAQKESCMASCGPRTYWNGKAYVDNQKYNACDIRCSQISCY